MLINTFLKQFTSKINGSPANQVEPKGVLKNNNAFQLLSYLPSLHLYQ